MGQRPRGASICLPRGSGASARYEVAGERMSWPADASHFLSPAWPSALDSGPINPAASSQTIIPDFHPQRLLLLLPWRLHPFLAQAQSHVTSFFFSFFNF